MTPSFLAGLNEQQLEAVTLPHQSALILAGAGSGKTRVLTTRIAWLIQSGQASPLGLLAVTFTNKAAKEMLTRISAMLPINTRGMWVGTFHGLCNRMLRVHHREAGLPQLFQILDTQDQLSLIKRLMKSMNLDEERHPPRQAQWFIAASKEEGLRAQQVEPHDDFTRRMREFYAAYDAQCQREGVVDFAELLLRSYELLSRNEALREHYRNRFRHILVDEFQDTNRLQYRWLQLLAGSDNTIFAVGDDDQCVVRGTQITMADGSLRPVEKIRKGDHVLACCGKRDFRPAEVTAVYGRKRKVSLVTIFTKGGRKITSTPEHTHFAGYLLGETPQTYFTYLMYKDGVGFRLGTSQVYTRGQRKPMVGFKQRIMQEHGDALWIIGTHASENEARFHEITLSLTYGLPTLPFVPRKGKAKNGLVHDTRYIERLYREIDTTAAASRLMTDLGIDPERPHHVPRSRNSSRRNIAITLCGDNRGTKVLHRICVMGNDPEGLRALHELGLSVRRAKKDSLSWRYETSGRDFGKLMSTAESIRRVLGGNIIVKAGFHSIPIPFIRARDVRPGMVMPDGSGKLDVVDRVVCGPPREARVFDLDVAFVHNFIANGLVTHNSIYAFRGANAANMQDLQRDFHVERVIKLEQNYRSHGHILDAANALIGHNRRRLGKNLWTSEGKGEPLRVYEAASDFEEAAFIVDEVRALQAEGVALASVAVLYRSNAQSRVLEHALFSAALPYRVYGGLRFFERLEVKHALAYLRLAANQDDDGALLRVINFPTRGIGNRSLEQLQELSRVQGITLWAAACANTLSGKAAANIAAFVRLIESMREATAGLPLPEIIEHVIETSGLRAHYRTEKEGADRLENLGELINAAAAFVAEREVQPPVEGGADEPDELTAFLAHAALEAGEHQALAGADALQLMTVHSAKGLEFHSVFVSGLEEGLFPHENSLTEADGIEEERRLMYVALTRARRRLYLSLAQSRMLHGQTRYNVPSRFFQEIPEGLMRRVSGGSALYRSPRATAGAGRQSAAIASDATQAFHSDIPWKIGQSVTHAKFGPGVIVSAEGRGTEARVQVNFRSSGLKWLMLEYAKLTPA
jgi:DNA helicase II / ATP-dependent DNA helicase PcrA